MSEMDVFAHFTGEDAYPALPAADAVAHLRAALRCDTTGHMDTSLVDYAQFDKLHALIAAAYPRVMAAGECRRIGHSLLITLPGQDPALAPALFMAHQDVVPAADAAAWQHGPFSGDLADGYIWGRGALDIKQMLIGLLEAAEYLLGQKKRLARTVYLAFGEDEETRNSGAAAIAAALAAQGVRLAFVLDEGGGRLLDGAPYGAPGALLAEVCVGEKGYLDMTLSAAGAGGHSSDPWEGTSLGALAAAIDAVQRHPLPPQLGRVTAQAFRRLAPRITDPALAQAALDPAAHTDVLAAHCMASRQLYNQVSTTIAPTMITSGAHAGNVMPGDMQAVINFRLAPHDTVQGVLAHCRRLVDGRVQLGVQQGNDASALACTDTFAWQALAGVLARFYGGAQALPVLSTGSTDARQYEGICDTCLRCAPFIEQPALEQSGVHGRDERISVRSYLQGIRCLIAMMEATCA